MEGAREQECSQLSRSVCFHEQEQQVGTIPAVVVFMSPAQDDPFGRKGERRDRKRFAIENKVCLTNGSVRHGAGHLAENTPEVIHEQPCAQRTRFQLRRPSERGRRLLQTELDGSRLKGAQCGISSRMISILIVT